MSTDRRASEDTPSSVVEGEREDLRQVLNDAHVLLATAQAYKGYAAETPINTPWAKSVAARVKAARDHAALQRTSRGDEGRDAVVGWRSIESAPRDGDPILAYMVHRAPWGSDEEYRCVDVIYWTDHNGGGWVSNRFGSPSHWMPLPAPPGSVPEERAVVGGQEEALLAVAKLTWWFVYADVRKEVRTDAMNKLRTIEAALRSGPAASEEPR